MYTSAGTRARIRPSAAERERVVRRLRAGHVSERVSLDTFVERVDVAYAARSRDELAAVVADLPDTRLVARALAATADALSRWAALASFAWWRARLPCIVFPRAGRAVFGRSRACDSVVAHPSVSRMHALLRFADGRWWLSDLGSTNGTWVNGRRTLDEVEVRPGDTIELGEMAFRLVGERRTMEAR